MNLCSGHSPGASESVAGNTQGLLDSPDLSSWWHSGHTPETWPGSTALLSSATLAPLPTKVAQAPQAGSTKFSGWPCGHEEILDPFQSLEN